MNRLHDVRRALAEARRDPDRVVLEGFHALKHALRFGARVELAVCDSRERVLQLARDLAADVGSWLAAHLCEVGSEAFRSLWPHPPETGVLAIAVRPPWTLADLAPDAPVVLLERPAHPGNIGAVVRVAAAAGAAGVITLGPHDPWQPTALRTSAGLHFALPVLRCGDLPALGRPLVVLDPAAPAIDPARVPVDAVLAFGSERRGLSAELRAKAELALSLPMRAGVSSLNLASAVAAILYVLRVCGPPLAQGRPSPFIEGERDVR